MCYTSYLLSSQPKHDYIWVFAGDVDTMQNAEGSIIDFNGGERSTRYQDMPEKIGINNISYSSEDGELIAYSNACDVFNSDFQIMENGEDINPGTGHDANCPIGFYGGQQNSLMLPDPGGQGIYYYHKRLEIYFDVEWIGTVFDILYSYIDIASNSVKEKNVSLHKSIRHISGFTEAIQHSNGKDWWILDFSEWDSLAHTVDDTMMYVFKLDSDSLYFHHEQKVSNAAILDTWCSSAGQSAFSTDGSTLAMYCPLSGLDLYDFDRETAMISNYRHLDIPSTIRSSGVCFSPSNRFIYVSNGDKFWQIDLEEPTLESGLLLIDEYDPNLGEGFTANFNQMQLGPDCRIYMNSTNQTRTLHIINSPDEKGEACDFVQRGFELPYVCQPGSLPNFPHFRIDEEEVCDPDLVTSVFGFPVEVVKRLDVHPNPTSGELTIDLPEVMSGRLSVRDVTGQVVMTLDLNYAEEVSLDLYGYYAGMYVIEVVSESGERYVERVVLID